MNEMQIVLVVFIPIRQHQHLLLKCQELFELPLVRIYLLCISHNKPWLEANIREFRFSYRLRKLKSKITRILASNEDALWVMRK